MCGRRKQCVLFFIFFCILLGEILKHNCESVEELLLQGEAALKKHSFKDAEPRPVNKILVRLNNL